MSDPLSLTPKELDALRETASIGAGHAATALSQMTDSRIMISVPQITIASLEDVPQQIANAEEPIAAVLMQMLGDLTGRSLLVFPQPTALRLAQLMLRRPQAPTRLRRARAERAQGGGQHPQRRVPQRAQRVPRADAAAVAAEPGGRHVATPCSAPRTRSSARTATCVFAVETQFFFDDMDDQLRGFFLLLPDLASLRVILRAIRVS